MRAWEVSLLAHNFTFCAHRAGSPTEFVAAHPDISVTHIVEPPEYAIKEGNNILQATAVAWSEASLSQMDASARAPPHGGGPARKGHGVVWPAGLRLAHVGVPVFAAAE